MATPFIYREAAPGQQAVQYADMENRAEIERQKRLNDLFLAMSQQGTEFARTAGQSSAARNNSAMRSAEAEKDRALQREGYKSAEQIAAGKVASADADRKRRDDAQAEFDKQDQYNRAVAMFNAGSADAANLNSGRLQPPDISALIKRGYAKIGPNGVWTSAYPHPGPALVTPAGQQMDTIESIRARTRARAGMGGGVQVPFTGTVNEHSVPQDFVPSYPQTPVYPPSEFEQGYPTVIPQDEIIRRATIPQSYDEAINPRPYIPPPPVFDDYLSTDEPPKRRIPGAYIPY